MNRLLWSVVALIAITGCDSANPLAPTPNLAVSSVSELPATSPETPIGRQSMPLVITYAQGTESGTLHLQWTPKMEPSVTVWWAREDGDAWQAIPGQNRMKPGELQFTPAPDVARGRYVVELNGVVSRVLYLDGLHDGVGGDGRTPQPPAGETPSSPPVQTPPPTGSVPTPPGPPSGGDPGGGGGSTGGGDSCEDDANKGHGNDCDHHDDDNPGKKKPSKKKTVVWGS